VTLGRVGGHWQFIVDSSAALRAAMKGRATPAADCVERSHGLALRDRWQFRLPEEHTLCNHSGRTRPVCGWRPGAKPFEWEKKGVPVRIEIGPRDMQAGSAARGRYDGQIRAGSLGRNCRDRKARQRGNEGNDSLHSLRGVRARYVRRHGEDVAPACRVRAGVLKRGPQADLRSAR